MSTLQSKKNPYERFHNTELILSDELAVERTLLANERTLLSFLRSAVALLIAGATILHFSHAFWYTLLGLSCLPLGIAVSIFGTVRFKATARRLAALR